MDSALEETFLTDLRGVSSAMALAALLRTDLTGVVRVSVAVLRPELGVPSAFLGVVNSSVLRSLATGVPLLALKQIVTF